MEHFKKSFIGHSDRIGEMHSIKTEYRILKRNLINHTFEEQKEGYGIHTMDIQENSENKNQYNNGLLYLGEKIQQLHLKDIPESHKNSDL